MKFIQVSMTLGTEFMDDNSWETLEGLKNEKKVLQGKIVLMEKEIEVEKLFTKEPGSPKQKVD